MRSLLLALAFVGCGCSMLGIQAQKPPERLKVLAPPSIVAGWQIIEPQGHDFSIALPDSWYAFDPGSGMVFGKQATVADHMKLFREIGKAMVQDGQEGIIGVGEMPGIPIAMAVIMRQKHTSGRTPVQVAQAMADDLRASGIVSGDVQVKEYDLPIGKGARVYANMTLGSDVLKLKTYVLVDGKYSYLCQFITGSAEGVAPFPTREVMETFRVRGAKQ